MAQNMPDIFETAFAVYEAQGQIGEGGSGHVFKVIDQDGNGFALKLLNVTKSKEKGIKRFKNEMMFCLREHHPNIISVSDFGFREKGGTKSPFYVMPLCGGSLRARMNAGVSHDQILPLFAQLLDAVEAAHLMKVVHRDLKPENVLFLKESNRLQLADFGIARFMEDDLYEAVESKSNERLANFNYASPEQKQRGAVADQRSDIFALGLMLNELFTSAIPQGTDFKKIKGVAPSFEYLDRLVDEMIKYQPDDRPANIATVKERLIGYGNDFVISQKLSRLRAEVIPATEIDDPLIAAPPTVTGINYLGGNLFIRLSKQVSPKWQEAFHGAHIRVSAMGYPPRAFQFGAEGAVTQVAPNDVQRVLDYFKEWLPVVHEEYRRRVTEDAARADREKRDSLKRQIEAEETRARVLRETKV